MPFNRYTSGLLPNVMPFVYDLHTTLGGILFGFGDIGVWVLAVVALLWTIDCFVGFYLTLPVTARGFWRHWKTAWRIKRGAGFFRLNFDLHRAGGLWLWPMLFAFAWSSVTLVDKLGVYDAVMGKLFDYPMAEMMAELFPPRADDGPATLDWREAQRVGERLMTERASRQAFKIETPLALNHLIDARQYNYIVKTDRTFPADRTETVFFDADTGKLLPSFPTSSGHSGNHDHELAACAAHGRGPRRLSRLSRLCRGCRAGDRHAFAYRRLHLVEEAVGAGGSSETAPKGGVSWKSCDLRCNLTA